MSPQHPFRARTRSAGARAALVFSLGAILSSPLIDPAAAGPSNRERIDIFDQAVRVGPAKKVRLDFPAGQCAVIGTDAARVRFEVWAECDSDASRCQDRADRIDVKAEHEGDQIVLRLEDVTKFNGRFQLHGRLYVPHDLAVRVEMGAGELRIEDVGQDLDAQLGAGEVAIRMAEEDVRSVEVQVGVGGASLNRGRASHTGRGWLGKEIHWSEGTGRSRVKVELGVGEASVRLR